MKKTKKEAFMNVLFKVYSGMKKVYYAMDAVIETIESIRRKK